VLVGVTLFSISVRDCDVAANVVGPGGSFSFAWIKHDMGWPLCFQLSNDAAGCAHALWKCDLETQLGAWRLPNAEKAAHGAVVAPPSWSASLERPTALRQEQQGGDARRGATPPGAAFAAKAGEDFQRRLSDAISGTPKAANDSLAGAECYRNA
jgi:hypothetical protein